MLKKHEIPPPRARMCVCVGSRGNDAEKYRKSQYAQNASLFLSRQLGPLYLTLRFSASLRQKKYNLCIILLFLVLYTLAYDVDVEFDKS